MLEYLFEWWRQLIFGHFHTAHITHDLAVSLQGPNAANLKPYGAREGLKLELGSGCDSFAQYLTEE